MFTHKWESVAKKQERREEEDEKIDISENTEVDESL